jgi:hypothetical protein
MGVTQPEHNLDGGIQSYNPLQLLLFNRLTIMSSKERTQTRKTIRNVRGADLPPAWAQQAGILPDQEVDIVIQDRKAAIQRLEKLMDKMGEEAQRQGLTEKKLQELLQQIDDERRAEKESHA